MKICSEDLALCNNQQNRVTWFDRKVMQFDITGKQNEITMNKGLKYNKKVRGTGDDWHSGRCHMLSGTCSLVHYMQQSAISKGVISEVQCNTFNTFLHYLFRPLCTVDHMEAARRAKFVALLVCFLHCGHKVGQFEHDFGLFVINLPFQGHF